MQEMKFPSSYKAALLKGQKNTTIRVRDEVGKYKVGSVYTAGSYASRDWNIKIKIISAFQTTIGGLLDLEIPRRSIESIIKKENVSMTEKVELIRFKVIDTK